MWHIGLWVVRVQLLAVIVRADWKSTVRSAVADAENSLPLPEIAGRPLPKCSSFVMVQCSVAQQYEQPLTQRQVQKASTSATTDYPCPVCRNPGINEYVKGNEQKQMLRCSDPQREQSDPKNVAYFAAKGLF